MSENREKRYIKSVRKAFNIIEHLKETGQSNPAEVSKALGMSKGTVYTYLHTLDDIGLITKENERYHLSLKHLTLGGYVRDTLYKELFYTAKPEIDDLAENTREKAQVTVVEDRQGIALYQAHSDRAVRTDSHTGVVQPLHATASGKAYLSCFDNNVIESFVTNVGLDELTDQTITSIDPLIEEIEKVRKEGVAYDRGERIAGIRCVAAPVKTDRDEIIGAISVSIPEYRWKGANKTHELKDTIRNTARVIGLNVTYA